MVSAAIDAPGRLTVFAVVDRVLTEAMFACHFRMAIGTDSSELLTSVAANHSYSLLYRFVVEMVKEKTIGCCLVQHGFRGERQFDNLQCFSIAFDKSPDSDTAEINRLS